MQGPIRGSRLPNALFTVRERVVDGHELPSMRRIARQGEAVSVSQEQLTRQSRSQTALRQLVRVQPSVLGVPACAVGVITSQPAT